MDDNTLVAIMFVALMVAACVMSVCGAVASRRPEPRPRSERFTPPTVDLFQPTREGEAR